jgi:virulence-associated protein VapD
VAVIPEDSHFEAVNTRMYEYLRFSRRGSVYLLMQSIRSLLKSFQIFSMNISWKSIKFWGAQVVPMFRLALWTPNLPIKSIKLSVKNFQMHGVEI